MHQIRQIIASSACLAALMAQAAPPRQYVFTRPTVVATTVAADPFGDLLVFEDESYRFIDKKQELFIYGKHQDAWIHVLRVTTENGRFGHAPFMVQQSWDDGHLIDEDFAPIPVQRGRPAERVVRDDARDAYRVDSGVSSDTTSEPTSFWIRTSDLDASMRGQRQPATPPRRTEGSTDPLLFVPVQVNSGERLWWCIDTSSRSTVFDPSAVPHDEPIVRRPAVADLTVAGRLLSDVSLVFGNPRMFENHAVGGVLGGALLDRFVLSVDNDRHALDLIEPDAFDDHAAGHTVPTDWRAGVPVVRVSVRLNDGRRLVRRLVVDTAEVEPLVLRPSGAAGQTPTGVARIVELGDLRVLNVPMTVRPLPDAIDEVDGAIGMALLRRFRVTFDKRRQRILLSPASLLNVPFDYDASGVRIVANGSRFGIGDLLRGFASGVGVGDGALLSIDEFRSRFTSRTSLRVGDWIDAIDDRAVSGRTLEQIRSSFRVDGRSHTITVERFGQPERITFQAPAPSTSR